MAHFAQLDENNRVIAVNVVFDEDCLDENGNESEAVGIAFCKSMWGEDTNWKKTSYNTKGGVHYNWDADPPAPSADQTKAFRKNYAFVDQSIYDPDRDAFYFEFPDYPSWVFNENTCLWDPPVPYPNDGNNYDWDESVQNWVLVEN